MRGLDTTPGRTDDNRSPAYANCESVSRAIRRETMAENSNVVTLNVPQEQLTYEEGRFRRTLLGEAARNGVSQPEVFIQGLLLTGQAHHFYGPADCGKSWLALWASAESVMSGKIGRAHV